jgi:molybdate transport system substrate-binding protein
VPSPPAATPPRGALRSRVRALLALGVLIAALGPLAGCSSGGSSSTDPTDSDPTAADPTAATDVTGTVTVFAAASLTDAFTEVAEAFEEANPDADVALNFAASSALARQVEEGAPADVFASADEANMARVVDAGAIRGEPVVFATNSLQIIVAPGNPEGITGLADLADPDLVYVTAAPEVPIGTYAAQALEEAGVTASPSSLESDVRAVVTKVTSGEADAGIVYATDVTAAGDAADGVDVPAEFDVVATYPAAVTVEADDPAAAEAWIAFLTGEQGQAILASHGFGAP